jgi:hypothetical protein
VDDGVHGTVYYVSAEEPGTFEAGFDVTNTGRLAVTLAGVEAPAGAGVLGLRMGRAGTWIDSTDGGGDGAIVPFAPVTIEPGQGRYLVVHLRVTAETTCGPDFASGTARVFSDVSLRFGYGGAFERTAAVEAPFAIVLDCGDLPVGAGGFGS